MKYVTNGTFAILLIAECRQSSIQDLAAANNMIVKTEYDPTLDYILPYRKSYDRIIRAIAADLHELMHDSGFVNLNVEKWSDVKSKCIEYIVEWVETRGHLPIDKQFSHTGYISTYIDNRLYKKCKVFDVDQINLLTEHITQTYNIDLGVISDLPKMFYEHTVPYWEIDALYTSHKKMRTLIDEWCARDLEESTIVVVDDFFINA
jgi:hypothetical protein